MNPSAVVMWAFCACVGYLVSGGLFGAVAGLTVGLALTLVADFYDACKGK